MLVFYISMLETAEEKSKFEALYLHYRDYMFHIANSILHSPEGAEDAVHSAFIKIIENLHKINQVDCPKTASYIVIIVRNVSINHYNRNKRKSEKHAVLPEAFEIPDTANLAQNTEAKWTVQEIAAKIRQLPEIYRTPMLMKYYHEKTHREIANLLDLKVDTVRKRIQRGTLMLQGLMGGSDNE